MTTPAAVKTATNMAAITACSQPENYKQTGRNSQEVLASANCIIIAYPFLTPHPPCISFVCPLILGSLLHSKSTSTKLSSPQFKPHLG